jgi:acyl dehydratase
MNTELFSTGFDNLAPGASFTSPGRTITETDLVSFAALSGDWHPQHADASWAAGSRFGERIAHGMLVLSYSLGLAPIDPAWVSALRGLNSVRFKRPVPIGETIRVQGRVEEIRPLDEETGLVSLDWRVVNQTGDLVLRARLLAIWRRSPVDSGSARNGTGRPGHDALFDEVYL